MGGFGSGRYWTGVKRTVECSRVLDLNYLYREGFVRPGGPYGTLVWTNMITRTEFTVRFGFDFNSQDLTDISMRLWYSVADGQEYVNYRIPLSYTRPNYGGRRWWFSCPISKNGIACNRRLSRLYLPRGGKYFGCRQCHDLTYASCQDSHKDTVLTRLARESGMTQRQVIRNLQQFFFGKQPAIVI
jgi:hypothetical protein